MNLRNVSVFMTIQVFGYLFVSFIYMDLNPCHWEPIYRFLSAIVFTCLSFFIINKPDSKPNQP